MCVQRVFFTIKFALGCMLNICVCGINGIKIRRALISMFLFLWHNHVLLPINQLGCMKVYIALLVLYSIGRYVLCTIGRHKCSSHHKHQGDNKRIFEQLEYYLLKKIEVLIGGAYYEVIFPAFLFIMSLLLAMHSIVQYQHCNHFCIPPINCIFFGK